MFDCFSCKKVFSILYGLEVYVRCFYIGCCLFVCDVCGKMFGYGVSLE